MFVSGTTATAIKIEKFTIPIERVRTRQGQCYRNSRAKGCTYFRISE